MAAVTHDRSPERYVWKQEHQVLYPKNETHGTEDAVLWTNDCFAVFDGVSSGDGSLRIGNYTPGQFAVMNGLEALQEAATFPSPEAVVEHLSESLRKALSSHPGIGRPSYVFAAHLRKHACIIRVGDCAYLIDGKGDNKDLAVDRRKSEIRQQMLRAAIESGKSVRELLADDPSREIMHQMTQAWQPQYANADDGEFGYGVVNGQSIPARHIECIPVPPSAREIVLASDGYPPEALRPTLVETELVFHQMIEHDPLGIELWLSTRGVIPGRDCFDDRTYAKAVRMLH